MRALLRDPRFLIAGLIVLVILICAVFAPWLAPKSPTAMSADKMLQGMSTEHPLGTDEFGRDILSRIIWGARLSMIVSIGAVIIATSLGTVMGLVAGYYRGVAETLVMRSVDVALAFPPIVFAVFVVVFAGPQLRNVIIVIGILYMPSFARVVHSVSLAARELDYVTASRAIGSPDWRVLAITILPNVLAPILVQISLAMGNAIILEASLSFLGLGPPPPATAWGRMISDSAQFMRLNANVVVWPAAVISTSVVAFNILGDVLRDYWDPRLRT